MTVKGLHYNNFNKQNSSIDESLNPLLKHNGTNNSPSRDLNLNHYKSNQSSRPSSTTPPSSNQSTPSHNIDNRKESSRERDLPILQSQMSSTQ